VLQCAAVAAELIARAWPEGTLGGVPIRTVAVGVAWGAVAVTAWSGLEYLWAGRGLATGEPRT